MAGLSFTSRLEKLVGTPLFQNDSLKLSYKDRCEISYRRARAVAQEYAFTAEDVISLSSKFWEFHQDNIVAQDVAMFTILTIQYNLTIGTLAPFAIDNPELQPILKQMLDFDVSAQFMLTEISRGLDAINLETTATLLPNGDFDLHSPTEGSAKIMPPTSIHCGLPRVGIVFARLIVNKKDHGLRPFLVALGDAKQNCRGVTCRLLPSRPGVRSIDHCITTFDHVRLPPASLLGSINKPHDARANFLGLMSRVSVGSFAMAVTAIPCLAVSAYIVATYSMHRRIGDPKTSTSTIWEFRTQQLPVLQVLAQINVYKAYASEMVGMYKDERLDARIRNGIATTIKAVVLSSGPKMLAALGERLGARGLFEYNQIIAHEIGARGAAIAEGDVLALSIRLASELLIGRYGMPSARYPSCLLARHEAGVFAQCRRKLAEIGDHRGDAFNNALLPLCQLLVIAIGHRMAYEAALDAKLDKHHLDLFEIHAMKTNPSWYTEFAGIGWWQQQEMEEKAATEALRFVQRDLDRLGAAPFVTTPIISDEKWRAFVNGLPCFMPTDLEFNIFGQKLQGYRDRELARL